MRLSAIFAFAMSVALSLDSSAAIIKIPDDYKTIQGGIDACKDGDTVLVAPGTYVENISFNGYGVLLGSLFLTTGDTSYISQTVIDGGKVNSVIKIIGGEYKSLQITGFKIQNGNYSSGGGILCNDASPTISHNLIEKNMAGSYGGGIACINSQAVIRNNIIRNNYAGNDGGGISCYQGSPVITDNLICDNSCLDDGGGIRCSNNSYAAIENNIIKSNFAASVGGGIIIAGASPFIKNNEISDNSAGTGAGIYCWFCSPVIRKNEIVANVAINVGGAITCWGSHPLIDHNEIHKNSAVHGGGIICIEASAPEIADNSISFNSAKSMGGGILAYQSSPRIHHNRIFKCTADSLGGGVLYKESSGYMRNNTLSMNKALVHGGGIGIINSSPSIVNSIFWADSSSHGCSEIYLKGILPLITFCNIEGGYDGEGNIDSDPLFVDRVNYDFHLLPKSPCIDAGCPDSPPDPDNTCCDIGAFFFDQLTGVDEQFNTPEMFRVCQNYPNPFNSSTVIDYDLPDPAHVTVDIYDMLGRHVTTIDDGLRQAGYHQIRWEAGGIASGMYFYMLQAGDYSDKKKMIMIK